MWMDGWMDGGWEEQVISLDGGLSFILPMSKPFSYNLTRFFKFKILWTQFKNSFQFYVHITQYQCQRLYVYIILQQIKARIYVNIKLKTNFK